MICKHEMTLEIQSPSTMECGTKITAKHSIGPTRAGQVLEVNFVGQI